MRDYGESTYGDGFADVYDEWYANLTDTEATVNRLAELAGDGPVLELGVGTGRVAVALALATPAAVVGIDASEAMLARLAAKPGGDRVTAILGDMTGRGLPAGPFSLVYVTYNTFFGLLSETAQLECFSAVASRLAPGGRFVIEAFVPDEPARRGSTVELRSMSAGAVVLSVSVNDPFEQRAEGHFIELVDGAAVRLRPWAIRYSTPAQLDAMAEATGLALESRGAGWHDEHFDESSSHHVSTYARRS